MNRIRSRSPSRLESRAVAPLGTASFLSGPGLLQLLLPSCCASCGAARRGVGGGGICRACWRGLPLLAPGETCETCGLPSPSPRCRSCAVHPPPVRRAVAVTRYEGVARRLVHAFKFRGHDILASRAGELMAASARSAGLHRDLDAVVPVPSTARRNRDRGYDPAALLAGEVARRLGRPARGLVSRLRESPPQSTVPASERRANVRGAFASSPTARGLRLLLVDDVMTTGATVFEAARALQASGAAGIDLLVFARTPEAGTDTRDPEQE